MVLPLALACWLVVLEADTWCMVKVSDRYSSLDERHVWVADHHGGAQAAPSHAGVVEPLLVVLSEAPCRVAGECSVARWVAVGEVAVVGLHVPEIAVLDVSFPRYGCRIDLVVFSAYIAPDDMNVTKYSSRVGWFLVALVIVLGSLR